MTDSPILIDARPETVDKKLPFTTPVVTEADGFYQWARKDEEKPTPYRVTRSDRQLMAMEGVWQNWEVDGQVITAATTSIQKIHRRLPTILGPAGSRVLCVNPATCLFKYEHQPHSFLLRQQNTPHFATSKPTLSSFA
jgi:putative SOS response-associated peptidase YedK